MGRFVLLPLAFFSSGAAALIFEVLWFRALGRLLGNTVWAGAVVLAAFMLGIALGGMLAARWRTRIRRPARAFALAEAVVAASGVLIVWGLPPAEMLVGQWLAPLADQPGLRMAVRLVLALLAMLVPTIAMGMTLALGVRALAAESATRALGVLYAANTFGACVAPLAAEFHLIGALGLRGTSLVAMGLNLIAAAIALTVRSSSPAPLAPAGAYRAPPRLLVAAAIAGGLALALEVIWFRLLILYVPGSDENFAVMLAVMLAGIALGGVAAPLLRGVSIAWVAAASTAAVVLGYLVSGWSAQSATLLHYALPLMLPAAALSGALFTLLGGSLAADAASAQPAIGHLTSANTLGAAAGAALAALALLPTFGMETSLFLLAAGYVALPLVLAHNAGALRRAWPALVALAALAFFPFGRIGAHLTEAALPYQLLDGGGRVVRVTEGPTTTLQVLRRDRFGEPVSWRLLTDNYSMTAINRYAMRYMQLFAWLPLSLHAEPRRALLISYGAGNTARALLSEPELRELTVVDVSPEMLAASPLLHGAADPLKDPRARIVLEDGRHFLRTRREQFDIITAEPPPPVMAGVVNLYTREYFEALARRLAPGGLVTYWLPVIQFEPAGARAVVAAFCHAFPDCTLWAGQREDWILMGGRDFRHRPSAERVARLWRNPLAGELLRGNGLEHPGQLGATFLADAAQLRDWVQAPVLTDDFPKRMAPAADPVAMLKEYAGMLEPARGRANFTASGWIRSHWPEPLIAASLPFFAVQPALNAQIPPDPAKALPHIDAILRETDLRVPVLWLLDTDLVELAIVERRLAAGQTRREFPYLLGARALAERDFGAAAKFLAQAAQRDPGKASLAAYAACRLENRQNDCVGRAQ